MRISVYVNQSIRQIVPDVKETLAQRFGRCVRLLRQEAGMTQVVFAEVHREPPSGPEAKSVTASIRGVSVETGKVRWSGTASVSSAGSLVIQDTQEGSLVELAMRRATCPVEIDFEWIEASDSDNIGGCRQRSRK